MRPKNVVRLDHTHSVLAIARGVVDGARDQATKDAAALGSIYSDLFDRFDVRSCSVGQTGWRLVVATKDVVPELGPGDTIVWGMPIGERGPLSEEEVASVRADPTRAREIVGSYVLVFIADESIDLVVSASLPHLLTRTDGPLGTALATRSLAGHALTGRRPEIRPAAVVELLLSSSATATA